PITRTSLSPSASLPAALPVSAILLVHTQPIGHVAAAARLGMLASADLRPLRIQLIADAGAALFAVAIATALSVYKPWGLARHGQIGRAHGRTAGHRSTRRPSS